MQQEKKYVLFTKQLTSRQQKGHACVIDSHSFIKINYLPYEFPSLTLAKSLVFTSKNAVDAVLEKNRIEKVQPIYVIGKKTKKSIEKYGKFQNIRVPKIEQNAEGLISLIQEDKTDNFVYFCGKQRLPFIENYIKENKKECEVVEVYDTLLSPPLNLNIDKYSWLCFCSPTAVFSYLEKYEILPQHQILCIGNTTAMALQKYEKQVFISPEASVESMLNYIEEYYKKK